MNTDDISHLASLARIRLTDEELAALPAELDSIVSYVSTVSDIAASDADTKPDVGVRHNVLRPDVVTNEPNQFTEDMLTEMPAREGRFMKVKKILNADD